MCVEKCRNAGIGVISAKSSLVGVFKLIGVGEEATVEKRFDD